MKSENFVTELLTRKYTIVSFLFSFFLVVGLVASAFSLVVVVTRSNEFSLLQWINLAMTLTITGFFAFIRFYYLKKNFKLSFIVLLVLFSLVIIVQSVNNGASNAVSFILMFLVVLSTSIVISVRASMIYAAVIIPIVLVIAHLQDIEYIKYEVREDFLFANVLIYSLLIVIGVYIVKTGYEQIEHSYKKAYEYAKELEDLNKYLDDRVKFRTRQLEESLERQAESVHSAAVMGRITKAMLHDLATPLSSLTGSYELLKKGKYDEITKEILKMSDGAVQQIERIVENAKHLMDNRDLITEFSPYDVISIAIFVSKHELDKDDIFVDINIDPKIKIKGVVALFERAVVNLIVNAIEELRQCDVKRKISISGFNQDKFFVLKIMDNGRGIRQEYLDKVFDPDFTSKSERNLGFGLTFVKTTMEKKFGGSIQVRSEVGNFTEFTLKFNKEFNVTKQESKKNSKQSSKRKSKKSR